MENHYHPDFGRLWLAAGKKVKEKKYWLAQLAGQWERSSFPSDYKGGAGGRISSTRADFTFAQEISSGLITLSTGSDVRLHIILTALVTLLLAKYTGRDDIIVGSPILKSKQKGDAELINTVLPLRTRLNDDMSFKELLLQVRQTVIEADAHRNYPMAVLRQQLAVPFSGDDFPLFDVALLLENIHDRQYFSHPGPAVIFSFSRRGNTIDGTLEYQAAAYTQRTIERIVGHLQGLAALVLAHGEIEITDIELLSTEEKKQLLFDFNHPHESYPADRTIQQLFASQVEKMPDLLALVGKESRAWGDIGAQDRVPLRSSSRVYLCYRALNKRANRLAAVLIDKGVQPDTIVALMVERSVEMIVGILGILKAGAAYLPINPKLPRERIDYMLADCGVALLLTTERTEGTEKESYETLSLPSVFSVSSVVKNQKGEGPSPLHHHPPPPPATSLAYIIYTSGSTGTPKGVPISHANLSPLIHWGFTHLGIGPGERTVQNLAYYFDWSVWEICITLTSGAALYMIGEEIVLTPEAEVDFILENGITVLHITPSQYRYLVNVGKQLETLKYLFIGAERLTADLAKRGFESVTDRCRVFNMYGPTETTIISAVLEIDRSRLDEYESLSSMPIGSTVANNTLLILDDHMHLCPVSVPGELCISGAALSRGYLNNPELSADRFTYMSYRTNESDIHGRLYKTGDRCRWLPDGSVEFLGRLDQQVKVRGYRIEPGEIENRLLKHAQVKEALVMTRPDNRGENYLCAYIVARSTEHGAWGVGAAPCGRPQGRGESMYSPDLHTPAASQPPLSRGEQAIPSPGGVPEGRGGLGPSIADLREFLSQTLPDYMVPAHFIMLERMPLNPNGKVDVKALPVPHGDSRKMGYAAPRDSVEKELAQIWGELLEMDQHQVGINDNFFELGGHSLRASILVSRIHKAFDVKVALAEVFATPNIRELAEMIKGRVKEQFVSIEPAEVKEYYVLSSAQRRLYLLQQSDKGSTAYNMSVVVELLGAVQKEKLAAVFRRLIERHESLRTSFAQHRGEPMQKIHLAAEIEFATEHYEPIYSPVDGPSPQGIDEIIDDFIRPFDLSSAPLLRVGMIKAAEQGHIVMLDMHHIISDGVSLGIFTREFMTLYEGQELPPLRIQYKDYAEWQHSVREKEIMRKQEEYWLKEFSGHIPVLDLPSDFPGSLDKGAAGKILSFEIEKEQTASLHKIARGRGTTLYVVLLSIFNIFLARLSGQEDIVVGTPSAGRPHADLEPLIGMFVNTLGLRCSPGSDRTFNEFLQEVNDTVLNAFENQEYQFEELVEKIGIQREAGRNPLFDVMFALQNAVVTGVEIPGMKLSPYEYEVRTAQFDLCLQVIEAEDSLACHFEYRTGLFEAESIKRFVSYFLEIVAAVVGNEEIKLGDIKISHKLAAAKSAEREIEFGF